MEINYRYPFFAILDAIKKNDVEYIKSLEKIDDPIIFAEAVYHGRTEIMRILLLKDCPIDYWTCHHAERSGRKDMVELLKKLGIWSLYYKDSKTLTRRDFDVDYDSD